MNTYAYSVTVTDPNNNCVVYSYAPIMNMTPVEQSRTYYQGCGSTAPVLKTVATTYAYDTTTPPGGTTGAYGVRPSQVTTTLANGQSSMTQTQYEPFTWSDSAVIGTRMNPTSISEFDHGASSPTLTTTYTYLHNTGSSTVPASTYLAKNIVDRVRSKTIYAGSATGTPIQTVTYDYDNYTGGVTASGAVQHDAAAGNYGNVTSATTTDVAGSTSYTTSYSYEDTGNIVKVTDPKGNSTGYSWADTWSDSSCALQGTSQGHIYLTGITNAKQQTLNYSYNSCTGTLASMSDVNSQSTTFQYDALGRTLEVDYPDGGQKGFSYNDPASMTATQKIGQANRLIRLQQSSMGWEGRHRLK